MIFLRFSAKNNVYEYFYDYIQPYEQSQMLFTIHTDIHNKDNNEKQNVDFSF